MPTIETAPSAVLRTLEDLPFEAALIDVNLPDGRGTDLLRDKAFAPTTTVIVMTAEGGVAAAEKAFAELRYRRVGLALSLVVIASFNAGKYLKFPPDGFSLRWYANFFGSQPFMDAMRLSLVLAVVAAAAAHAPSGFRRLVSSAWRITSTAAPYCCWSGRMSRRASSYWAIV